MKTTKEISLFDAQLLEVKQRTEMYSEITKLLRVGVAILTLIADEADTKKGGYR